LPYRKILYEEAPLIPLFNDKNDRIGRFSAAPASASSRPYFTVIWLPGTNH